MTEPLLPPDPTRDVRPLKKPNDKTIYTIIDALRHLSAQPDPMTVTGRLRWEDNGHLYFGKIYVGREFKDMFGHYQCVPENWVSLRRIDKPTREEARAALVEAVKEAIGG